MIQTIRVSQWLLLIMGAFCIFAPNHIVKLLPYLMGISMTLIGSFSIAVWSRNRRNAATADLAYGLILLIVGVSFVFQGQSSLISMGIVWAIIGIRKSTQTLIRLIDAMDHQKPHRLLAIEFFVRILLALLLLFDPYGKFTPHLRVLGAELIVNNLQSAVLLRDQLPGSDQKLPIQKGKKV